MIKDKIKKRFVISNGLTILMLIVNLIISSFNLDNLVNSSDTFKELIGAFSTMLLPYMIIAIIIQIVVLVLFLFDKQKKQLLNVVLLIIELLYFIFTNILVVPFMFLNLFFLNKILAYIVIFIFEILNIYVIILIIMRFIKGKKNVNK